MVTRRGFLGFLFAPVAPAPGAKTEPTGIPVDARNGTPYGATIRVGDEAPLILGKLLAEAQPDAGRGLRELLKY